MAYAAVISLKRTIERYINPSNPEITASAYEKLNSLGNFLRRENACNNRNINRSAINSFDAGIREAVYKLEDVIESYALHHPLPPSKGVKEETDAFMKTVIELEEKYKRDAREKDDAVSPFVYSGGNKSTTVGLSDQYAIIKHQLLNPLYTLAGIDCISLLGMAGIGKTHLVRQIYDDPTIVQHFHFKAWVSFGPKAKFENVLVDILAQIEGKPSNLYIGKHRYVLGPLLNRVLQEGNYLIVFDDLWSIEVFTLLERWLPSQRQSRLLVTTRLGEVAKYCWGNVQIHQMRFMNNEESWNLLWQNVFGTDKSFPPQLEKSGRKIAVICEGLPLLILAVADILRVLDMTEEYWKKVVDKKTTTFSDAIDKIFNVLITSYEYLPQHLKACFLYMGAFPLSSKIPLSKLISLWTVEDFFEPSQENNLDDFSGECLEELVSNSLVIACTKGSNNITRSSKLHFAYWHMCVKEARKNKFLHVLNTITDCSKEYMESQRRLSVQNNVLFGIKDAYDSMADTLTARSLLCTGPDHVYPVPMCFDLVFLKVLDALAIHFYEFPKEVLKLLQLRYLALTHYGKLSSFISKLQQLQCLIIRQRHNITLLRNSTFLPKEIWDLQELRYLRIMGSMLQSPSKGTKLPNLSTLDVNAHSCTRGVFRSIPHLKKLRIKIELQPHSAAETLSCLNNIMILGELDSLKCVVVNPQLESLIVASHNYFSNLPRGLRKLSLNGIGYSWKYMSAIGSLPNLKVLKLRCYAFQGPEWEIKVDKFHSLEFLQLEDIDLVHWTLDGQKCFPSLRCLIIQHCYKLETIPPQIGFNRNLEKIEVVDCSPSIVASAQHFQKKRNLTLKVLITSSWD